jgi:hypothetical protein
MKSSDPVGDPFQEWRRPRWQERVRVLGGEFCFESDSRELLKLVRDAYAGLPAHILTRPMPRFVVRLVLGEAHTPYAAAAPEPSAVRALAGGELLGGALAGASFMTLSVAQRSALIVVGRDLLRFSYHVRYELLEFVVYCLAARAQGLVPLHAACVGRGRRALLLLGASGAGKSTVVLHSLIAGLDFLAEDSVLVGPESLLATGVANFLHLRGDSLRFVSGTGLARQIRRAPVITRRSGVEKYEFDLRRRGLRLARVPPRLHALVFLSAQPAGTKVLLRSLPRSSVRARLHAEQRYAANQRGWTAFLNRAMRLPAFELRRGTHPSEAVGALERLLRGPRDTRRKVRR